ncbi:MULTISPECIES: DNA/RNA non-specific endonuclease [Acetobacter]|uniref:DNA/RNA non-specific endonuclease n=1 Tax=Acetobacter TaxID=434 RepID=UPI0007777879|nr:DNA/RNA non-specific endonuclease [Acetobacter malorum]MCP1271426.1 DNA/RNA non-specific endonuclease [Acetobacter cerevisiae]MCP1279380.1 DNA/RNA non-specific endonuclease [Acetobacter cerevisiae]
MRKGFHKGLKLIFLLLIYDVQVDWAYGKETCSNLFFAGESPTLEGEFGHGRVLCNTAYAVMDSPVTKGPIWSAEYIVEENLEVAARTKREGYFYPDARLPAGYRGELADWKHSGWDRGHLSPSGDFAGLAAQQESYALSNVVPQAPGLNRGAWEGIEAAVRGLANAEGELYVVTGVLFSHHRVSVGPDRVMIPSGMWKAVYDPIAEGAAVYVCANTNQPDCKIVSLEVLSRWAGIDVFPSLAVSIKQHIMPMPAIEESPYAASVRTEQSRANGFSWNDRRVKEVLRLLQKALGR